MTTDDVDTGNVGLGVKATKVSIVSTAAAEVTALVAVLDGVWMMM